MSKSLRLAGLATVSILALNSAASAGGFALREQSAVGLGNAFAGAAAGGSGLGSMFWNPATMTQFKGTTFELSGAAILPYAEHKNAAGTSVVGNSGEAAVVP